MFWLEWALLLGCPRAVGFRAISSIRTNASRRVPLLTIAVLRSRTAPPRKCVPTQAKRRLEWAARKAKPKGPQPSVIRVPILEELSTLPAFRANHPLRQLLQPTSERGRPRGSRPIALSGF